MTPSQYIQTIQSSLEVFIILILISNTLIGCQNDAEESRQQRAKTLETLAISLRGQTLSFAIRGRFLHSYFNVFTFRFVKDFVDHKGLTLLLDLLSSYEFEDR